MHRPVKRRLRSLLRPLAIIVVAAALVGIISVHVTPAVASSQSSAGSPVFGQPTPATDWLSDGPSGTSATTVEQPAAPAVAPVREVRVKPKSTPDQRLSETPLATWKVGVIVYRSTDVKFRVDGRRARLTTTMSDELHALTLDVVDRIAPSVHAWSAGLANMALTVIEPRHPLKHLARFAGGYWVDPTAIAADLARYAPAGRFDSIIVVWPATDYAGTTIPQPAWGLTLPPGPWANGAGFSSISAPESLSWWSSSVHPEEVFVHEWLHQVLYFHADAGLPSSDLDASTAYGYAADADGSWQAWLSDVMTGRVSHADQSVGLGAQIWAEGTPTAL